MNQVIRLAAGKKNYSKRVRSLFGPALVGYWPMTEASGLTAFDRGLSGATAPTNYLMNPGFEGAGFGTFDYWIQSPSNGTIEDEGVDVHGGSHAVKLTAGAAMLTNVGQHVNVRPNTTYTFTVWSHGDGTHPGRVTILDYSNGSNISQAN